MIRKSRRVRAASQLSAAEIWRSTQDLVDAQEATVRTQLLVPKQETVVKCEPAVHTDLLGGIPSDAKDDCESSDATESDHVQHPTSTLAPASYDSLRSPPLSAVAGYGVATLPAHEARRQGSGAVSWNNIYVQKVLGTHMDESIVCMICNRHTSTIYDVWVLTGCNHVAHELCVNTYIIQGSSCPLCIRNP